jgi:hypothetical protein
MDLTSSRVNAQGDRPHSDSLTKVEAQCKSIKLGKFNKQS